MYSLVVVTVCLKAGLEMESWSWISHVTVWGSIAFWFCFLVVYSFAWPLGLPLAANMAGMVGLIVSTPLFWLGLLMVPFAALIPDLAYKSVRVTAFTTETDKIRIAEIMKGDVSPYVPASARRQRAGLRLTESSALLRNVRKVFRRNAAGTTARAAAGAATAAGLELELGGEAAAATPAPPAAAAASNEEIELAHGYAFSQEEGGAVSQAEFIRRYDTTDRSPRGGGGTY